MKKFGALLRVYRLQCIDPQSGRLLTQERLAELLGYEIGVESYSGSTISNWERGINQVRRDARNILVSLIKVLHLYGGIKTSEESNQLLLAGNYRSLDNEELEQANPEWKQFKIRGGDASLFPSFAHQEVMLPTSSYTRLFGITAIKKQVVQLLLDTKAPYLIALVGLGGTGKTAIADSVVRHTLHQGAYAQVIWVSVETGSTNSQEASENYSLFQAVIHTIFTQLFPEQAIELNAAKELIKVRLALKQHRYLVIVDNLESSSATNHLLSQLSKLSRPTKFLLRNED